MPTLSTSKSKLSHTLNVKISSRDLLRSYWTIAAFGMVLAAFYFMAMRWSGEVYPYNTPLYHSSDRFMDFFNVNRMMANMDPYREFGSNYTPFGLLIGKIFGFTYDASVDPFEVKRGWVGRSMLLLLMALSWIGLARAVWGYFAFLKTPEKVITFVLIASSYPFLFLYDRGNYLSAAFLAMVGFALTYDSFPRRSALYLAIAVSIKLYLGVFLLLFLMDRRFRSALETVLFASILNGLSLFFFQGSFFQNLEIMVRQILTYTKGDTYDGIAISFQNSVLTPVRIVEHFGWIADANLSSVLGKGLLLLTFVLTFLVLRFGKDFATRMLALTVFIILIQPMSPDYNLILLAIPFLALMATPQKIGRLEVTLLSLLFIFKGYWVLYFSGLHYYSTIQSVLNPIILMIVLAVLAFRRIRHHQQGLATISASSEASCS